MNIVKTSLCVMFLVLGVIFIAPTASAEDEIPSEVLTTIDDIKTYMSDQGVKVTGELGVDYHAFWFISQDVHGRSYYSVTLFDSPDFTFDWYESGNSYGVYNVTSGVHWCYNTRYFDPSYSMNAPSRTYIGIPFPKEIHGTFPVEWIKNADSYSSKLQYGAISTVQNIDFTHIKPVLTDYLVNKGWSVAGAYLADSNLSQTQALNVVTNYNDLPDGFEGLYCLQDKTAGLYKFSVAVTPGTDPNAFSEYWDDYLVVVFDTSKLTNVTCYFGCEYPESVHPLALKIGSANWVTDVKTTPMVIYEKVFRGASIGTAFDESQATQIRLAIRWRYNNTSAIPRPEVSPLYVGFDYSNEVDGTVVDGNNSTDYTNYETTYYNTTYQQVINGLTGTISGPTSFSANWGGEMPDTTIGYDDHVSFDDAGLGSFFQRIWSVGDGYFTSLLLAVLAVAFAAYLLYGRS